MPMVRIATNVSKSSIPHDFGLKVAEAMAESLQKPISHLQVEIQPDVMMNFGGSPAPMALVSIRAIDGLGPSKNGKHVEIITNLLNTALQIHKSHIVVEITQLSKENVGHNGILLSNFH